MLLITLLFLPTENDTKKKIIEYADKCLAKAAEYKLIKPADQAGSDEEE